MADQRTRPATPIVIGSGVAGPQTLVTSGQLIDRSEASVTWQVNWNMSLAGIDVGRAGTRAQGLLDATKGTLSPLVGGAPAGTFLVEGSNDDTYYVDLGVTVSSLFGVASSGVRIINVSGTMPDYQRLRYFNTSSSGVFDVYFGARSR